MIIGSLFIKQTADKGRGIFTDADIDAETVIEVAPVIVMKSEERIHIDKTLLHDYIFEWGIDKSQCCMALGYVPIYNHSYKSNCEYFMDYDNETVMIKTVRVIAAGDEVTINYNGDWDDEKKIWFDVK
jgi:uncharacterized protein